MNHPLRTSKPDWLEDAVFYQIYPQSFYDSDADGIGDIPGIIRKLDYLQSLGIKACWLNPCFESPFQDAGYDVSDYFKVAERYGTNEDLKLLFEEGWKRGIRFLLDLVPGHTSIHHPWFKESCRPGNNNYTDYYIWTDSAWKWEVPGMKVVSGFAQRNGSYISNFFYFQPALNYGFACPDPGQPWQQPVDAAGPKQVRQELKNIIKFWLDLGASGFRVDMAGSLVKADPGKRETIKLWQEIRLWLDENYPHACLISEWASPKRSIQAGFHADFCLPFGTPGYTALLRKPYGREPGNDPYGFSFFDSSGHGNIMEFMDEYLENYHFVRGKGHIALPTGNHDINPRLSKGRTAHEIELVFLFILTMPGIPFIWYGDEIGMRSIDDLPSKEGGFNRTASRTPMQWSGELNAGFSSASPEHIYLPIDPKEDRPTVQKQEHDPGSLLNAVREMISIRHSRSAFQASAAFELVYAQAGEYPLIYSREDQQETYIVVINPSRNNVELEIDARSPVMPETIYGTGDVFAIRDGKWMIRMPPISGGIYQVMK